MYSLTTLSPISYTNTYRMDIERKHRNYWYQALQICNVQFCLFPIEVDVKKYELSFSLKKLQQVGFELYCTGVTVITLCSFVVKRLQVNAMNLLNAGLWDKIFFTNQQQNTNTNLTTNRKHSFKQKIWHIYSTYC